METSHWLVAISLLSLVTALPISEFFEFDIHKSCNISIKEDMNNQLSDKCNELYFPREVNCSVVYQVDTAFPLFDEIVTTIKVYMNGYLTLNEQAGKLKDPHFTIAAFQSEIDITDTDIGNVYIRPSTHLADLKRANRRIRDTYSDHKDFKASWVFVVTWYRVAYYSHGEKHNTFQTVLITDGEHSFAINNYEDDGIQWSSVLPNGTGDGSDGVPAQAGYNDGTGLNCFVVPGSNTSDISSIASTSNADIPGLWIFRLTYPMLELRPYFLLLALGDEIVLNCIPPDHTAKIMWLKNDEVISDDRINYLPDNSLKHVLRLSNSMYSDNGTYTCGLDVSGKLVNAQGCDVSILRDSINVYKDDGDQIVTNAIINRFGFEHTRSRHARGVENTNSGSGMTSGDGSGSFMTTTTVNRRSLDSDTIVNTGTWMSKEAINLVGISTSGNEGITWNGEVVSGSAVIEYNPGTDYVGAVEVAVTSSQFKILLTCSSTNGTAVETITVTTDNPCVVSLNGSFLLVKQGSTPTIDFMVAVNSDGVTELHTSVKKHLMFSFTNNELTTMFLPLPHVDPSNFQHYSCKLPPMDSSWAGNYTLSFNDPDYGQAAASLLVEVEN